LVTSITAITHKGHSSFITLRRDIMEAVAWRRGDKLVAVVYEDMVIFRKVLLHQAADTIVGAMIRRARGPEEEHIDGQWDKRRGPAVTEP
jgi:hypothetical protein